MVAEKEELAAVIDLSSGKVGVAQKASPAEGSDGVTTTEVADTASGAEVAQTGPLSDADAGRFKVGEKATIFLLCGNTMVTYQAAEGVFVEVPGSRGGKNEYGWKILCLVEPVLHRHHQVNVGQTVQWGYVHEVPAATQHHQQQQQQQQQQQHGALEASPALLAKTRAVCESEGGMQGGPEAVAEVSAAAMTTTALTTTALTTTAASAKPVGASKEVAAASTEKGAGGKSIYGRASQYLSVPFV